MIMYLDYWAWTLRSSTSSFSLSLFYRIKKSWNETDPVGQLHPEYKHQHHQHHPHPRHSPHLPDSHLAASANTPDVSTAERWERNDNMDGSACHTDQIHWSAKSTTICQWCTLGFCAIINVSLLFSGLYYNCHFQLHEVLPCSNATVCEGHSWSCRLHCSTEGKTCYL